MYTHTINIYIHLIRLFDRVNLPSYLNSWTVKSLTWNELTFLWDLDPILCCIFILVLL